MAPPTGAYLPDSTVVVTATADPGWDFLQWLGDGNGDGPIRNVLMTRPRCVEALFGTAIQTTLVGSGSILADPSGAANPYGSVVRLTAIPDALNYFAFWANALEGSNNPGRLTITNAVPRVTAIFAELPPGHVSLVVVEEGRGTVESDATGSLMLKGAQVTLLAKPDRDQEFVGWSGDAVGLENPLVLAMDGSRIIRAAFSSRPRLSVSACGDGRPDEGFRCRLTGEFGTVYRIEASEDGAGWRPLGLVTNLFGTSTVLDIESLGFQHRYYRAVSQ